MGYCSGPDKWGSVPNPRAIFPRAPEGSLPTPRAILPRAPYRPRRHTTEGSVPTPRAIFPRAPEGSVPTPETYYRGLCTDPGDILPRAPYRPPEPYTEGSHASPLCFMRHSIEKNPHEGLTWSCAPSNLIVGGSLGSHSPSDLLQVRRRRQRSSGGRNPTRTTVKIPINRTPTIPTLPNRLELSLGQSFPLYFYLPRIAVNRSLINQQCVES
ncbi:hypothetical protein RHGRI_006589 [Rhododendron griersonianum]|uniref:Uncharacterized protein n=1 Tax=Rhododendron griersonianum TaxID=479676 RepID=A0AAV6KUS5_9ERIC|nr:hypothetical protein RHGRI_006589 [Rhododendron griersonianum]